MKKFAPLFFATALLFSCGEETKEPEIKTEQKNTPAVPVISYSVSNKYPHDTLAFTEGFLVHKGQLFESTGSPDNLPKKRSVFGITDLKTGKIEVKVELDRKKFFAKGS